MGDLFWNKIAGVVIGLLLLVMVIRGVGNVLVSSEQPEGLAYPLDISEMAGPGAGPTATVRTDLGVLLASASAATGERIARRCVSCHTFTEGGAQLQGPNLWNIVGDAVASEAGFNYSSALRGVDGFWDYAALDHFIENPRGFAPGTNMAFAGIRSETDRADLLAYLQSQSASPVPFPAPAAVEPEDGEAFDAGDAAPELIEVDDPEPHGGREVGERRDSPDSVTGSSAAAEDSDAAVQAPTETIVPGVDRPIQTAPVDVDVDEDDEDADAGDNADEPSDPEDPQP